MTQPNLQGLAVLRNGTTLLIGIREPLGASVRIDTRGQAGMRVTPYVAHKAGGLWYVGGNGSVPNGVVWRGLERWLWGRHVEWIDLCEGMSRIWPSEEGKIAKVRDEMGDK